MPDSSPAPTSQHAHVDTHVLKTQEQFDYWRALMTENGVSFQLNAHETQNGFNGSMRALQLGLLSYSYIQCEPNWVLRSAKHINSDNEAYFFLYMPLNGTIQLEHNGQYYKIDTGECALIDGQYPLKTCQSTRNCISLRFPQHCLPGIGIAKVSILNSKHWPQEHLELQRLLLKLPFLIDTVGAQALEMQVYNLIRQLYQTQFSPSTIV